MFWLVGWLVGWWGAMVHAMESAEDKGSVCAKGGQTMERIRDDRGTKIHPSINSASPSFDHLYLSPFSPPPPPPRGRQQRSWQRRRRHRWRPVMRRRWR
jgi:hypothetical protein